MVGRLGLMSIKIFKILLGKSLKKKTNRRRGKLYSGVGGLLYHTVILGDIITISLDDRNLHC